MAENEDVSDEEIASLIHAAAKYEELADEFMGGSTLQTATAVFSAVVDDVRASRIEWHLEGSPGESYESTSNKHVIRDSRSTSAGLQTTPALADNVIRGLARGSSDALKWYQDWVGVFLQAACRTLIFSAETLQPGQWERLRIRLQFKHCNGRRTTVTSGTEGTSLVTR